MNREAHVRRSLPRWLELPGLAEVVIVDWSTRESLVDLLALDPRVRLVRVEGEPRWMQPYPTNLGVAQAACEHIVKCDADCVPHVSIGSRVPAAGTFYAGHWRSGAPLGKACVNGQCVFTRAQFEQVNGYSEVFRVYGRDDEDFYDRLAKAGHARAEIAPALLEFHEHSQEDRVVNFPRRDERDELELFLHKQGRYHEMTNLVISAFLPWGPWFDRARYDEVRTEGRFSVLRRDVTREIPLADPIKQAAHASAVKAVVTQLFALAPAAAARLDHARCLGLLRERLAADRAGRPSLAVPSAGVS